MSSLLRRVFRGTAAAAVLAAVSATSALAVPVLLQENYDADPVGPLPPGWTLFSGEATPSGVSADQSVSPPNSFEIEHDGNDPSLFTLNAFTLRREFTPHSFSADSETMSVEFDMRMDQFGDGSEGFVIQVWNGNSGLTNADFRIFKWTEGTFGIQSSNTIGALPQDQWINFRMEIDATTDTTGDVRWYLDDALVATQTYNNAGGVNNVRYIDIRGVQTGTGTGSRMYLDNVYVAIPEPASIGLVALGALTLMRRTREA